MKNRYKILCLGVILLTASCAKDKSNYDFQPKEVITVKGIEANYTTVSEKESLVLNPEVSSTDPNAKFEYLWGIYETSVQGSAPVLDTIGRTKELNYLVLKPAKGWVLVFRVTNVNTKYSQYFTSSINVVTQFTRGWYVAKDDGIQSDLDLFLTPTAITPVGKLENVYSENNGKKLEGKASMITFFSAYKSTVTGVLGNTRALFLLTDKNVSGLNINTLKEIRGYNTLFYDAPAVKAPDAVFLGSQANYLVNNGQCHSLYAMSANTGQFGVAKIKDDLATPYHLSKYFFGYWIADPFFFDETSSSFLSATGTGAVMTSVSDAPPVDGKKVTDMPANNNNKKMLYMGYKASNMAYAMFQDKTVPSLKILSAITPNRTAFKMINDTLQTTSKIYNATRFALLDGDENMIYFVLGNEIWSRNLSNKFEQLQYTAPAGEEVTFVRHRKYTSEAAYAHNYVMIGTKSGSNYKVRMFTKSSGNLASTPAFTLEGTGIVRDVLYMSPSVSETTYSYSY
ncbi:PKD-like family lipoprotein [Pedobacter frigoris]|uniref:PKD-like family lipoprotein n=1 Tax=Pedobacter frigoris TaxID=2571272 RepID=UPI00293179D2|nr:PKD-like family lipoprotein [Pedobacter frigoris]